MRYDPKQKSLFDFSDLPKEKKEKENEKEYNEINNVDKSNDEHIFKNDNGFVSHPKIKKMAMKLKEFQTKIAEDAINNNMLIVIPTGMGKTEIAILAYAEFLNRGKGKLLFLAPSKPLVNQAMERFNKWIVDPPPSTIITGAVKPQLRSDLFKNNFMIFATPQTIEEDLSRNRYNLSEVDVLVIDEAHKAIGNHAYVLVCGHYFECNPGGRIIGLTASPSSDPSKVLELKRNLHVERIEYRNKESVDMLPYVSKIHAEVVKVQLVEPFIQIRNNLKNTAKDLFEKLQKEGFMEGMDFSVLSKKLIESYFTENIIQTLFSEKRYHTISIKYALTVVLDLINYIETESINMFKSYVSRNILGNKKKYAKILANDDRIISSFEIASRYNGAFHPKQQKLYEVLNKFFSNNPQSLVIVFTSYREMADELSSFISQQGIPSKVLVGQGKRTSKGLSQKEQVEVVEKFKNREFKVLVATNIGEEGLDVPDADLIIFYDSVSSEIRKIQRMGRTGRQKSGNVVFILAEDTQDIGKFYSSMKKEKKMYYTLKNVSSQETFEL
ncbi:MAG: helicase-related protein [Thermoplasmata archaeon]